jgi:hypothetical protein
MNAFLYNFPDVPHIYLSSVSSNVITVNVIRLNTSRKNYGYATFCIQSLTHLFQIWMQVTAL